MINDLRTESRQRLASRPRPEIALIEVPSALGLHPSGVQDAPDALREAGCISFSSPPKSSASMSPRIARRVTPRTHMLFSYGTYPSGPLRLDPQEPEALSSARFGEHVITSDDIVFADDDGVAFVPADRVD